MVIAGSNEASIVTTINNLQDDFISLARTMKTILINKDRSGELKYLDFRENFIYDLPEAIKDECQSYFEKKSDTIFSSTNYDKLFIVLGGFWNYLNPFLLEHFILRCGGKQLQSRMSKYVAKLEKFMNGTSIDDFLKALPSSSRKLSRPPPGLQEFITRHKLPRTASLQHIENIRAEFCRDLQLTRFSLYIAMFSSGSVIIVWYVTARVAKMLTDLKQGEGKAFEIISIEG